MLGNVDPVGCSDLYFGVIDWSKGLISLHQWLWLNVTDHRPVFHLEIWGQEYESRLVSFLPFLLWHPILFYSNPYSELCPKFCHLCSHLLNTSTGGFKSDGPEQNLFFGVALRNTCSSCLVSPAPGRCNTGLSALTLLMSTITRIVLCTHVHTAGVPVLVRVICVPREMWGYFWIARTIWLVLITSKGLVLRLRLELILGQGKGVSWRGLGKELGNALSL